MKNNKSKLQLRGLVRSTAALALGLGLSACATTGGHPKDPLEPLNRATFQFNEQADRFVIRPVAQVYDYVPLPVKTVVGNFFGNLGDVPNLLNSLLQFKGKRSLQTTGRLLLNTTVGVAGLWDPATRMGLPKQSEDFGQTLGFYGVPDGPYVMLPLLGPSNLRDTGGLVTDFVAAREVNYLDYSEISREYWELPVLEIIDKRYSNGFRYGQMNSPFEYEKVRYVYTQSRKLQIAE
mgnify:CR=1 FL=1